MRLGTCVHFTVRINCLIEAYHKTLVTTYQKGAWKDVEQSLSSMQVPWKIAATRTLGDKEEWCHRLLIALEQTAVLCSKEEELRQMQGGLFCCPQAHILPDSLFH